MKNINVYLEGGGSKCAYQLSFLKTIINNSFFTHNYNIKNVYGISFGALIGYVSLLDKAEIVDTLMNTDMLHNAHSSGLLRILSNIPVIGTIFAKLNDILCVLRGIHNYGFYSQQNIEYIIKNIYDKENKNLHKLKVIVYNLTKNEIKVVPGSHPKITDYILASMSCWLLFPPKKITKLKSECIICSENIAFENNASECVCDDNIDEYVDPGFYCNISLSENNDDSSGSEINCYLFSNKLKNTNCLKKGNNLFEFLFNIIDYVSNINQNNLIDKSKICNKKNTHIIVNDANCDLTTVCHSKILENLNKGSRLANIYLEKLKNNENKIFVELQ